MVSRAAPQRWTAADSLVVGRRAVSRKNRCVSLVDGLPEQGIDGAIHSGTRLKPARLAALAITFALLGQTSAMADTIILNNGDRLSGRVHRLRGDKLELETSYAGTISIDASRIISVETDSNVTVILKDYTRHIGRLVPGDAGVLTMQASPGTEPVEIAPERVSVLLPGVVAAEAWRITGRATAGATDTSGNTDVTRVNLDGEIIARRNLDRWSLAGNGNQADDRGIQTEGNATIGLKYDRFISESLYLYGGSTLEHDRLKDLRLRSTVGTGAGYQILDRHRTRLSLEAGIERVRTDFFSSQDQSNISLGLASRFDHWLMEDLLQLFHTSQMFTNPGEIRQSFARTQTGLRMSLRGGLLASVRLDFDWDGSPAPGRRSADRAVVLSVGYKW